MRFLYHILVSAPDAPPIDKKERINMAKTIIRRLLAFSGAILLIWFIAPLVVFAVLNIGNILGIPFSLAVMLYGIYFDKINGFIRKICSNIFGKLAAFIITVICALVIMFTVVTSVHIFSAMHNPPPHETTVVVLGCQVRPEGPSLMLWERIDAAYKFLSENESLKCVVSGGQGADEPISEAECMYNELVRMGISPDRIYLEDKSTSTYENLLFSQEVIKQKNLSPEITIITNDFHQYRASEIAASLGIENYNISGQTNILLFPTFYVRELCGILHNILI